MIEACLSWLPCLQERDGHRALSHSIAIYLFICFKNPGLLSPLAHKMDILLVLGVWLTNVLPQCVSKGQGQARASKAQHAQQ